MANKALRKGIIPDGSSRGLSIRSLVTDTQKRIESVHRKGTIHNDPATDYGLSYSAVLLWASRLVQDNPNILTHFASYVRSQAVGAPLPNGYEQFAAPAIEWFLLGLT